MKSRKALYTVIAILVFANLLSIIFLIYEKNSKSKIDKVWDLATNNAIFLYQQYQNNNVENSYDYALGEMGTIVNSINLIHYGEAKVISEDQKKELSFFYTSLYNNSDSMKQQIAEIINIVTLLRQRDDDAFKFMKELRLIQS